VVVGIFSEVSNSVAEYLLIYLTSSLSTANVVVALPQSGRARSRDAKVSAADVAENALTVVAGGGRNGHIRIQGTSIVWDSHKI
jgi:hypothetical protein